MKKTVVGVIKWLLIALILYFIIRQISGQWEQVRDYNWKINWLYFIASILLLQIGLFYKSFLWSLVLRCFGVKLPALRAFRVSYLSNLGRYVPGKVVQFVGIIYLARKEGVREDIAVSSFALSQFFDTPAGILLVFIYYLLMGTSINGLGRYLPVTIVLGVISLFAVLIILMPSLLERLMNLMLRLVKRPAVEFKLEKRVGFGLLFLYFIAWNIFGASFYLFMMAVTEAPVRFFLESCLINTASYLIGYWALFAPGGFGVREGVVGVLLYEIGGFAESVAYMAGLASRLWFMIGELTVTVWALLIKSGGKDG